MKRYCNKCGTPVVDDQAIFCNRCGSQIPNVSSICNSCGATIIDNQSLFCDKCGSPLNKTATVDRVQNVDMPKIRQDPPPLNKSQKKYSHIPLVADELQKKSSPQYEKKPLNEVEGMSEKRGLVKKQVQETRCTCSACGNVWYYGKREVFHNAGNLLSNATKDLYACSCCFPLFFLQGKEVTDVNKCPNCGSRAIQKEQITHDVE